MIPWKGGHNLMPAHKVPPLPRSLPLCLSVVCCGVGVQSGYDCFSLQKRLGLTGSASLAKDLAHRTEDITGTAQPIDTSSK